MKKLIFIILGLFFFCSANAQQDYFTAEQEIHLQADTVTSLVFQEAPTNTLFTCIVVCNDTTVTDTLQFYEVTEHGDTLGLTLRATDDWSGTADISVNLIQGASSCDKYLIMNPYVNQVFIRAKGILTNSLTNGIQYRIYLQKAQLQ